MLITKVSPAITRVLAMGSASPWARYSQVLSPTTAANTARLRATAPVAPTTGSPNASTRPASSSTTSS